VTGKRPLEQTKHLREPKYDYALADGTLVPGVTTIVRLRDKPFLKDWAFRVAKENPGLSSIRDYTDDLARIGTCAHHILMSELSGMTAYLGDFTPNEVEAAQHSIDKYHRWAQGKVIVVHEVEGQVISERHRFGGTFDFYAVVDGLFTIADLKTGARIYREYVEQGAAYAEAKKEMGQPVEQVLILQMGRTEGEGFSEEPVRDWRNSWMHFLTLRQLYDIEQANKKGALWTPPTETPFVLQPDPMEQPENWQTRDRTPRLHLL
jgi:hypothetical protein